MTYIKICIIRQKKSKSTNSLPTSKMSLLRYRPNFEMQATQIMIVMFKFIKVYGNKAYITIARRAQLAHDHDKPF